MQWTPIAGLMKKPAKPAAPTIPSATPPAQQTPSTPSSPVQEPTPPAPVEQPAPEPVAPSTPQDNAPAPTPTPEPAIPPAPDPDPVIPPVSSETPTPPVQTETPVAPTQPISGAPNDSPGEVIELTPEHADVDSDGDVDKNDFEIVASNFGSVGANLQGDVNSDGRIDLFDASFVKSWIGRHPAPQTVTSPPPPTAAIRPVSDGFEIRFDQEIEGLDVGDFELRRNGVAVSLSGNEVVSQLDGQTYRISGLDEETTTDGAYELRLKANGSQILGDSGALLAEDVVHAWSLETPAPTQTASTVDVLGLPTEPSTAPIASLQIRFDAAVENLSKSDLTLLYEGQAVALDGQTLHASGDGKTWTLSGLDAITGKAGVYNLIVSHRQEDGTTLNAESRFVRLANIRPSDDFLRMIVNPGHHFWQHERFTNFDHYDGESYLTHGTRLNYANDPAVLDSIPGLEAPRGDVTWDYLRQVYDHLYQKYEAEHPEAVTGSYISAVSFKDEQRARELGFWPLDVLPMDAVEGAKTLEPFAHWKANNGRVDLKDPASFELLLQLHIDEALGRGSRPKQEIIHYDEVQYVYGDWPYTAEFFKRLKQELNDNGVLISTNLGGYAWADPSAHVGANVIQEITEMTNSVMIESIWGRDPGAPGGSFRTVENTQKIINNLRTVMDAGLNVELLPTRFFRDVNNHDIASVREVQHEGQTKLLVTTNGPHHIFPTGGYPYENFRFDNLPPQFAGLENVAWSVDEVPGSPNQVYVHRRFTTLEAVKANAGVVEPISFSGGEFVDQQASTRMSAGLALLARNPGHKILVNYTPGGPPPGGGDPTHPDNWWYWPELLGEPTADYVVDSVDAASGEIATMHRNFQKGRLWVHPHDGHVRIELFDNATV